MDDSNIFNDSLDEQEDINEVVESEVTEEDSQIGTIDNNVEPTKKEKAEAAGRDVAELAAKGAGRYFGGPIGGAAVDAALNTKFGQKIVGIAGKNLSRNPIARNTLARNQENISRVKPVANTLIGNMGSTDNSSVSNTNSVGDNSTNNSNKVKGSGAASGLWNKSSPKTKLIISCIVAGLVFVVIFIAVIIIVLDQLSIVDIFDTVINSSQPSSTTYLKSVGNKCSSIILEDTAIDLEDYVAGVVSAEAYTSEGMEALKAQAIAARTYAINRTNQCSNAIRDSSADQNYTSDIDERARQATEATRGLVLTYDSELFTSEYDSFYTGNDYVCDDSGCSVTYSKLPNNEKHTIHIDSSRQNYIAGGHGRGMSQVVSYELAEQGYKFDYILSYFYSPGIQISSLYGTVGYTKGVSGSSANFVSRTTMPKEGNESDKKYYYSDENISYAAGYLGECTWYAYGRANEILDHANSNLKWSYAPHAKSWLDYNINSLENAFSYSSDVTEPKVGAIIVWSSDAFGHVAVVEKVNSDGTIDYSEANIQAAKSESNPYGFRYQSNISYKESGIGNISNIWDGYQFVGYIYMVE